MVCHNYGKFQSPSGAFMCHENHYRYIDQLACTVEPCLADIPENTVTYMYDNVDTLFGPECHLHRLTYKQTP